MVFRVKGMLLIVGLRLATCISIEMYLLHYMKIRYIFNLKKKERKVQQLTALPLSCLDLRSKEIEVRDKNGTRAVHEINVKIKTSKHPYYLHFVKIKVHFQENQAANLSPEKVQLCHSSPPLQTRKSIAQSGLDKHGHQPKFR